MVWILSAMHQGHSHILVPVGHHLADFGISDNSNILSVRLILGLCSIIMGDGNIVVTEDAVTVVGFWVCKMVLGKYCDIFHIRWHYNWKNDRKMVKILFCD